MYNIYIISQRIRKCLLSLPLQDGQEMREEAIERVAKHVILKTYDAGEDVIMKGIRFDFRLATDNK